MLALLDCQLQGVLGVPVENSCIPVPLLFHFNYMVILSADDS